MKSIVASGAGLGPRQTPDLTQNCSHASVCLWWALMWCLPRRDNSSGLASPARWSEGLELLLYEQVSRLALFLDHDTRCSQPSWAWAVLAYYFTSDRQGTQGALLCRW